MNFTQGKKTYKQDLDDFPSFGEDTKPTKKATQPTKKVEVSQSFGQDSKPPKKVEHKYEETKDFVPSSQPPTMNNLQSVPDFRPTVMPDSLQFFQIFQPTTTNSYQFGTNFRPTVMSNSQQFVQSFYPMTTDSQRTNAKYFEAYECDQGNIDSSSFSEDPTPQYEEYQEDQEEETDFGKKTQKTMNAKKIQNKPQQNQPKRQEKKKEIQTQQKVNAPVKTVVTNKEFVEVDTTREPCSMVFIGHVDSGKSTISGSLIINLDLIDKRTIEKFKQEAKEKGRDSWWIAYVMDSSDEEKAKGKTVEVGRATLQTKTKQVTLFDAPGHKNYIPDMIMGAACADYAGLVISARKGEYEAGFEKDGQTREHVQLAKSLGVQKLIIIVNKMDDPTVKWNQTRWNDIRSGLTPFLLKTGYQESDIYWVPISGLYGLNLTNRDTMKEICPWYDGPCFIEILDNMPIEKRDPNGTLRIPILDKYNDHGIIVHGKVVQGTLRLGDSITLSPHNTLSQVSMILDHKGENVKYARPGENVQVKLQNIKEDDDELVQKGYVICSQGVSIPASNLFEAEIELLELLDFKPIFSRGCQCMLHIHTFADECQIKDILVAEEKDQNTGVIVTKENPKFTRSFAKIRARVSTRIPVSLEKFDVLPELGRFTLRDEGKTIAVGRVLRYKPYEKPNANVKPAVENK